MRSNPDLALDAKAMPSGASLAMLGRRFGRLFAVNYAGRDRHRQHYIAFICDCGRSTTAMAGNVRSGATKSCGCFHSERSAAKATHGNAGIMSKTGEYRSWVQMKTRCFNAAYSEFHLYGGRGITVCDRWRTSFEAFLADMGRKPGPHYSIDRYPNPDGNYEPGNCRWATPREQANNRRKRS